MADLEKIAALDGKLFSGEGDELFRLSKLAPGPIVEIGSLYGKSTCYLAAGSTDFVYSIDLWETAKYKTSPRWRRSKGKYRQHKPDVWERYSANIKAIGVDHKIISIKASSFDVGETWTIPIGGLFIDGEHTYEACLKDYQNFSPHVISGGWIAIHDYHKKVHAPIVKVVEEVLKPSGEWEEYQLVNRLFVARKKG